MALVLATYNVLDLFGDDAACADAKANALGPILRRMNADVMGLQEVASDAALASLLRVAGWEGGTVVHGTRDGRGIGCTLVTRLKVVDQELLTSDALPFPAFVEGDPPPFGARIPLRRAIVSAVVESKSLGRVRVMVAHFKSGRGVPLRTANGEDVPPVSQADWAEADLRALVFRIAEALFLRRAIDAAMARGDADHVAVLGDFNDVSGSLTLRVLQGGGLEALSSVADAVPRHRRYSTLHRGQPEAIDHILVTRALGAALVEARFDNVGLVDLSARHLDAPRPAGSDHAPLIARFEAPPSSPETPARDAG